MINHSFPASRPEFYDCFPGCLVMSGKDEKSGSARKGRKNEDEAFDLWLRRGLHQLFDDVTSEPIPEELLRLIQDDKDSQP